ncbi:MAG: U32 family peptidase [Lachnospiraceae bacterium]|nr:U32 family peptidase [Lachnospiraceae bacterium]
MRKPELLAPAGNLDILKTAVMYGADAVYIGGEMYGLRANAKNFDRPRMEEGISFAHEHGAKVYVTANIIAHNRDIDGIEAYLKELAEIKPDAILVADPGIFMMAKELCPNVDLHISTQANNVNYKTYEFWKAQGATRVVTGRELSIAEISEIHDKTKGSIEIESFIHGAMCISYSGRCLLSAYMTGREANLGACTHPCRWKYALMEETRPGEFFPVFENERGTFIMNSKDLCMIEHIPELVAAGVDSFKIEGRMKPALYVAVISSVYREAIDDFFKDPFLYESKKEKYRHDISMCSHRPFGTGFYFGKPGTEGQLYDESTYDRDAVYLGTVENADNDRGVIYQKNKFFAGEEIELMRPFTDVKKVKVLEIRDDDGNLMESCPHPLQKLNVKFSEPVENWDILRRPAE